MTETTPGPANNRQHDLFLLMLNLSQMNDPVLIGRIFAEAMESEFPGLLFQFEDRTASIEATHPPSIPDSHVRINPDQAFERAKAKERVLRLEVSTAHRNFGTVLIEGRFEILSKEAQSLIRNAVRLLAIILENRAQAADLERRTETLTKEVQENEAFIKGLAQVLPILIYIYDTETDTITYVNDAARGLLASDGDHLEESVVPKRFIHPDDLQSYTLFHEKLLHADVQTVLEIQCRIGSEDESMRWLILRETPLHISQSGTVQRTIGCGIDITERELTRQELSESLNEKELLLSEVHHRVKNNMSIISGLLSLQSARTEDATAREALNVSLLRVHSMAMIHEMLYEDRNFGSIDFKHYVSRLTSNLFQNYNMNPDSIRLELDIQAGALGIDVAVPCGLLVNELVTNSLKYAFRNGRSGTIRVAVKQSGDILQEIRVSDDGGGMPADFDPETDGDLGLKLVMSLSTQLGLTPHIRTAPGEGTEIACVREELETDKQTNAKTTRVEHSVGTSTASRTHLGGEQSVFIVEDEAIIVLDMRHVLSGNGFLVVGDAKDGLEALEKIERSTKKPDVVFMDIGISGELNGIETARRINERFGTPIIFRTGYADEAIHRKIAEAHLRNSWFLSKSATDEEMIDLLRKAVRS